MELGAGPINRPDHLNRRRGARPLVLVGLVAALLVISHTAGCGSAPSPVPTATLQPAPDPKSTLALAVANLLELKSAAFTLEHQIGSTALLPGLVMKKATGVVDIPGRLRLTVEAELLAPHTFVEINVIIIGEQAYMTDFLSGEWRAVPPESLPVNFLDFGQTLAGIVEAVADPALSGVEEVAGRQQQRITGMVPSEALSPLVPGAAEGLEVKLELWLDQETGLLRRVLITGPVLNGDVPETVRLLSIDDVNVPVDITPPE